MSTRSEIFTDTPARRPLPPVYLLAALGTMGLLHLGLPIAQWVQGWWRLLGALPILFGAGSNLVGDRQFERHGTTIKPFARPRALVVDGVFRFSRNPMYLGMVSVLLGAAVALGSVGPLLVPPVFAAVITRQFIVPEERALRARFGDQYVAYAARGRRWL